ncbi:multiprotein-bridging factor 1 family protein [Glutamicibacter creatinolyticus]|uniref:helix-turn-helix domain-containing protein n=1 Tax=Glutamicibacter creatinolyticus TaxID=162496 RepID=UPI0033FC095D
MRKGRGWISREDLAHNIDLDRTYVSAVERRERNPTLDVSGKLIPRLGHQAY